MKFKKLGKNFSVFYIYGANLPYSAKESAYRTCPNGLFIKSAVEKSKILPKQHRIFNPSSPYDLETLYNVLAENETRQKDTHSAEAPPGTIYYK